MPQRDKEVLHFGLICGQVTAHWISSPAFEGFCKDFLSAQGIKSGRASVVETLPFGCFAALRLSLALGHVEGGDGAGTLLLGRCHVGELYLAELLLVAHDVLLQGKQQALGVLGGEDDAAAHLRLGHAGQHTREVEHEVAARMGDYREVCIFSLCCLLGQLNLELSLLGLVLVFAHNCVLNWFLVLNPRQR